MSSLSEMPELVMVNIIGLLDFRSVLTIRQVCRDFLNFIDDLNDSRLPDSKFDTIEITVSNGIRLSYIPDVPYKKGQLRAVHTFLYSESENSRSFNGKITSLENANIVNVAIRDLEQVLKFQKSTLKWSSFVFLNRRFSNHSPFSSLLILLSHMFNKRNRKIKTKFLSVTTDSQSGFMSILPFFDSVTLEQLCLHRVDYEMQIGFDEIVRTEQWKNAKSIRSEFFLLNMKVEDMCHLQRFYGKLLSISARDLDFWRKAWVNSSKFDHFRLQIKHYNEHEEVCNLWGPAFVSEDSSSIWYFQTKVWEKKILCIQINQQTQNICFENTSYVPRGAIVHDYEKN
ncbi:unnamed protein product [Caenorhabditis nigoni]